ncbi:hypothetical protein Q4F19_13225 [Sphingomonas sp. BIUV-7]|uniref:Uncharacterized protein n=1 Tax=Sphingomonas natans TaxID=3063330 RepID=A0ABT8YCB6_9SPHN|nr:hypothetical protein [Sphingomonas sp. BIUV-7]MDO6415349.1 hypothetical protein [Sphingomonas sp. BIUV-7]
MAPPTTPADALALDDALENSLAGFDQLQLVIAIAGLQTDPAFQANAIRFEWLTRLALACCRGTRRPSLADLNRLLNAGLAASRIPLLEDPIEDVLVEPVCTQRGAFLIFTGAWEKAGFCTETVLGAFSMLPEGEPRGQALNHAYALLALSDALVRRAGLPRFTIGGGTPKGRVKAPDRESLEALSRRVVFTWHDLADLGIDAGLLTPFVLDPANWSGLREQEPGASMLEFRPLLLVEEGVVVAAPGNLSTAVRALLIDTAITGGMNKRLRVNLLAAQSTLVGQGGLVRGEGPVQPLANGFARESISELSLGRYVHALFVIEDFGAFPKDAFTFATDVDPAFGTAIADAIVAAHHHAVSQPGFRQGVTFLFLAGWGSGLNLELDLPALPGWQVIALSPHDGLLLGACDDATAKDLAWMDLQFHVVRGMGFEFAADNGFLNRFQLWRNTDHAFIPVEEIEARPPIRVSYDSNLMLQARREAYLAWDRRSLLRPGGVHATVMRMSPRTLFEERQPIYASYTAVQLGRIASAVVIDDWYPVWFELEQDPDDARHGDAFETFKAMLEWAGRVLPAALMSRIAPDTQPIAIGLIVQWPAEGNAVRSPLADDVIAASVRVTWDDSKGRARITLGPHWQIGLQRPDNYAEAALAAAVLDVVRAHAGVPGSSDGIVEVRGILGSNDARWRHAITVNRVIEALKAYGLVQQFEPIPESVSALVRTGIGWATRERDEGPVISGKAACRAFLDEQAGLLLASLRAGVRRFRRETLVTAALGAVQAAQADERHWGMSARALRAIHGDGSDRRVSFERHAGLNVALRASTIVAELAQAECPALKGLAVGTMDLSELQAHALLYFETIDMIPAIEAGRLEPVLRISPTGIIMRDHGFEENTIRRTVRVVHEAQRDRADRDYGRRMVNGDVDEAAPPSAGTDPALQAAVLAEYGVPLDGFVGLAQTCCDLAVERGSGIVTLPRSELAGQLAIATGQAPETIAQLLDRLILPHRNSWDDVPSGATARDFDLGKLDRRFSPIGRPLLALDAEPDPLLTVAPGLVERCILHNLQGAITGILQGDFWTSSRMRSYVGERGRIEGNEFNDTVAERLRGLGLTAYAAAKPAWCFNHKNTPDVAELGDFDVLALSPDGSRAWIVEAKDLKLCRTIGETARRLTDYEGRMVAGKPDKMLRHLRRVAYARAHAADLARRLKLTQTPVVAGLLVVNAPQPMEAMRTDDNEDARVVMLSDLDQVTWF